MKIDCAILDKLNDDCLESIFRHIEDLPTQVEIARVCKRFRDICVTRIWCVKPKYRTLCIETLRDMLPHREDVIYYLTAMREHFTDYKLPYNELRVFIANVMVFHVTSFTGVHQFTSEEDQHGDRDIELLNVLFPNLKILNISASISGRHLKNFKALEELYLYAEFKEKRELENGYLKEIVLNCKNLRVLDIRCPDTSHLRLCHVNKCQNLEILKVNLSTLKPALNDVLSLPKLKSIVVRLDVFMYNYTEEFYEILARKADRITSIAVDNFFMRLRPGWDSLAILKLKNLRTIAISDWKFDADMLLKYAHMTRLEKICCRWWPHLTTDIALQLIKRCRFLMHFDISFCKGLDKRFLDGAVDIIRKNVDRTLHIYYRRSSIEYEVDVANAEYWRMQDVIVLCRQSTTTTDNIFNFVTEGFEYNFE